MTENIAEQADVDKKKASLSKDETVRKLIVGQLMSTPEGRRYIWLELSEYGVFSQCPMMGDHAALTFFEGKRSMGVRLMALLTSEFPQAFVTMLVEANPKKEIKNVSDQPD